MNEKNLKLIHLFEDGLSRISESSFEFNAFLKTAAHNYRMSFNNAVAAYAQKANTDLLLTYEQWQLYGRVPKRYSKQILLFDNANAGRYVVSYGFSSTVNDKRIKGKTRDITFFNYKNNDDVLNAVKSVFDSSESTLKDVIYQESLKRFENYFDDAYPAFENEEDFLAKAVTNMMMSRFGEDTPFKSILEPYGINRERLPNIYQMAIDVFRKEYSELATSLPVEIEKQHQNNMPYQVITNAGDDGGYDEKLEYANLDEAIQSGNNYLSDGYLGFSVYNKETKHIEHTYGDFDVTKAYSEDVIRNSYPEPTTSLFDKAEKLSYFDEETEFKKYPFFGTDDVINEVLATANLRVPLEEINRYYDSVANEEKREEYIHSVFDNDNTEVVLKDGTPVGCKPFTNGVLFWKGDFTAREGQRFIHWNDVAGHFEAMQLLGVLKSENAVVNISSVELIDKVVLKGSNISDSKFRIYEHFNNNSSSSDNISFLKNEYGWGGSSSVVPYSGVSENHNGKGIELSTNYMGSEITHLVKWSTVEQRIRELIELDQYLTEQEMIDYSTWQNQRSQPKAENRSGQKYAKNSSVYNEYIKIKIENPNAIVLFQIPYWRFLRESL